MIDEFSAELINCPLKTVCRHSAVRTAHDAEAEDIIRLFEVLDNQNNLCKVQFAALQHWEIAAVWPGGNQPVCCR